MKVLVSFLGRTGKPGEGYRRAAYRFNGEKWPPVAYFGLELARREAVDRLVLFGTPGSMWDLLLADHAGLNDVTEAHMELMDAAQQRRVTQEQLETLQPLIERAVGRDVVLRLIGEAQSVEEQIGVLTSMAAALAPEDDLILDVTHGFRHLPMLALAAAAYLSRVRRVKIAGIYYGAAEMADCPVLELSGFLDVLEWVQALAAYDASGNLGQFAEPLRRAGLDDDASRRLRQAAFDERNQNQEKAANGIEVIQRRMQELQAPIFELVRAEIEERLAWTRQEQRWRREFDLAWRYLKCRDWTRAVIHATEAAITWKIETGGGNVDDIDLREEASGRLRIETSFNELIYIRNALVHGNAPRDKKRREQVSALVRDQQRLPEMLRKWMKDLEGHLLEDRAISQACE